ncbi:hypothetical protein AAE026_24110 [Bradyrhizobium sp. DN5]|uniref:hypothetical protein n=1 Tax=Bradyrhizobium sp. DN5 TaxID=3056950 RepID=UPI003525B1A9
MSANACAVISKRELGMCRFGPVKPRVDIAPTTGPFTGIDLAAPTLVMADAENLVFGARDLGRKINFAALANLLQDAFPRVDLHACYSAPAVGGHMCCDLVGTGWTVHRRLIIESAFIKGSGANADVSLAFHSAALIGKFRPQNFVLASGDGMLVLDIGRAIKAQFPDCRVVVTASLAGSTSRLIDARVEHVITQNIEIGLDVMLPLYRGAQRRT